MLEMLPLDISCQKMYVITCTISSRFNSFGSTDVDLNILHFEGTSEGLTGDAAFSTEPEVELPPLDMDLSDLHIPTVEDIHCL